MHQQTEENLHDKPFLATQPSLEDLAARIVAVSILQNNITLSRADDSFFDGIHVTTCVRQFLKLKLPESCKNKVIILLQIARSQTEVASLLIYDHQVSANEIPSALETRQTYVFLKSLTWTENGAINLGQTAKSMIYSDLLSDEERYKIACRCCITRVIYELAPRIVSDQYLDNVNAYLDPLVFYWSCCILGDMGRLNRWPVIFHLHMLMLGQDRRVDRAAIMFNAAVWNVNLVLVPTSSDFQEVSLVSKGDTEDYHSLLGFMLGMERIVRAETSFRYFWNQLPAEKRFEKLCSTLESCEFRGYLPSLALELSTEDQRDLLARYGHHVLCSYLDNPLNEMHILRTILSIQNRLSLAHFSYVLKYFLKKILEFCANKLAYEKYVSLLKQFWFHIPQPLRESAIQFTFTEQLSELKRLDVKTHDYLIAVVLENADETVQRAVSNSEYGKYVNMLTRQQMGLRRKSSTSTIGISGRSEICQSLVTIFIVLQIFSAVNLVVLLVFWVLWFLVPA